MVIVKIFYGEKSNHNYIKFQTTLQVHKYLFIIIIK